MLRRLLGGPNAGRNAVLAVLPVLVGAILLLGNGDRPSSENSLLETNRGPAWPRQLNDPGPTSTSVASATSPGAESAGGATAESPSPAAEGPADTTSTSDSPSAPGPSANAPSGSGSAPEPQTAAGPSTETAGSPAGIGDATAPAEESSTTADPTPEPTTTSEANPTPSTPPTQAAETTTTTPAPAAPSGGPTRAAGAEAEVVSLTNQDRSAHGLGALSRNDCLDSVASGYAEQMARSGVMAHNPGAGPAIQGCRPNSSWGDNVGTATPCDTAFLEREWMASPTHRPNILNGGSQFIGVGAWTDQQGGCWVQVLFSS